VAILALQLRIIWNSWEFRDLTIGDTAGYFTLAASWANHLQDDVVWSPLYTNFWGTILAVVGNVYAAATLHRLLIILVTTILVLALMRRLMHPALALLVAAWWAVVPANFNVLYEVHLFGVIPILIVFLILARRPGRVTLGLVLASMLGIALLMRNEVIIATLLLAVAIFVSERRKRRVEPQPASTYLRVYGLPLVIVLLLAGGAYWRSGVQGHQFRTEVHNKQGLNLCQVYAFNFQQRHPSRFRGNAFSECQPLMQQTFGKPTPTLIEATLANPRAVAGMVKWNLRLWPSGVQVALFNATSTGDEPDYIPVDTHRSYALVLSLALLALIGVGGWAIRRDMAFWREWWKPRAWLMLAAAAMAITTTFVVLTQRPRPEYMYALTVGIMALTGVCLMAVLRRASSMRFLPPVAVAVTLALIALVPAFYHKGPRPLHDAVERLMPVRSRLQRPGSVLVALRFSGDTCYYLSDAFNRYCTSPDWSVLQTQLTAGVPIRTVLDRAKATVVYADPVLLADPSLAKLFAAPRHYGWRQVAAGTGEGGPWRVFVRASQL
jgi:hypothetical protein